MKSVPFASANGLRNIFRLRPVRLALVIQSEFSIHLLTQMVRPMISRRTFIKQSALAVGGVAATHLPLITVGAAPKKIIIIGAGITGLSAGYELTQLGHQVTFSKRARGRVAAFKLCANLSRTACTRRPAPRAFLTTTISR
jgi:hypothetical protein